jgi:Zn-dependent oligopeptidase
VPVRVDGAAIHRKESGIRELLLDNQKAVEEVVASLNYGLSPTHERHLSDFEDATSTQTDVATLASLLAAKADSLKDNVVSAEEIDEVTELFRDHAAGRSLFENLDRLGHSNKAESAETDGLDNLFADWSGPLL